MATQFRYLFTPLQVGSMTVPNRILQTAHAKGEFSELVDTGEGPMGDGLVYLPGERNAYYYAERAKGGVGLQTTDYMMVHPTSCVSAVGNVVAYRKEVIPRIRLCADMVHAQGTGAKIIVQICHTGAMAWGQKPENHEVWVPSAVPGAHAARWNVIGKAMEREDIQAAIEGFAVSAANIKEGGMDGVEVHAAHSYLVQSFLSPLVNRRTDEYGGSLMNRYRFLREILEAVRGATGRDFPLGIRLSCDDFAQGGNTVKDYLEIARTLVGAGLLDFINVTAGGSRSRGGISVVAGMDVPQGFLFPMAAAFKQAVDIPIFSMGRVTDPLVAERILADGQADMVGMTRALIADPELPNKAKEGRLDDIRHCTGLTTCMEHVMRGWTPMRCFQNPAAGREKYLGIGTLTPAATRKRVLVIGGGPGGLKAAETAARRGHRVTLYEKEQELGGQVRLWARAPYCADIGECIRYLTVQNRKLGVKMITGTTVTAEIALAENPDAVVVATGCRPTRTFFSTSQQTEYSFDGDNVFSAWDVLGDDGVEVGQRVVVVDEDATWRSFGTAEFLADRGKEVTIVTSQGQPGASIGFWPGVGGLEMVALSPVFGRLRKKGVRFMPLTEVRAFREGSFSWVSPLLGTQGQIDGVDSIVLVTWRAANEEIYYALKGKAKELYRVGDAVAPRNVEHAIWDGEMVGRKL